MSRNGGAVTVVVPTVTAARIERLLESLAVQTVAHQTIVVDNGLGDRGGELEARFADVEVLRPGSNVGYSRACNLGAERAEGDALVLVNDDCVCDPGFLAGIVAPLDPGRGVVMAAGVMRDWSDPERIDSAGMELDRTLLVFDYLNGEPLSLLDSPVSEPIGPSGAAAAFDRATFVSVDGFDERLFAYWEDVDLVLRLRRLGFRCALAVDARGVHEHSATLGSGSARKNYLMGFGRGYLLRKWGVLSADRLLPVLFREAALCAGQALVDRNATGIRGRVDGYRTATSTERYPARIPGAPPGGAVATLRRRAARRARLRRPPAAAAPTARHAALAAFHLAETSGPSRSLEAELRWLADESRLTVVVPGPGGVSKLLDGVADVAFLDYEALTLPSGVRGLAAASRRLVRDVRAFRALIARHRPDIVISITAMLPAILLAARYERVPTLVYCGELFDRTYEAGATRAIGGAALTRFTGRMAAGVLACSDIVRRQFDSFEPALLGTIYPPIGPDQTAGDGPGFRSRHGIGTDERVVASVGYLTEGRGQDVALQALPHVRRHLGEVRYVIAGDPFPRDQDRAYKLRLERLAGELGIADAVVFAGHVEPAADVYAAADVVINPARFSEPFGRVPFEAAVAGTPAVVTRVGAVPELLVDGESASIVPPEDPRALGEAIARVLGDEVLGRRLVAGARGVVEAKLLPEHSLGTFQDAVHTVLERDAARRGRAR